MPNKEEVLKWYQSLQETLKAEGIDVTKPGDLMRIRSYYFREDPDMPGDIENGVGDIRYAFAKRNIDPKTGQRISYETPFPEVSKEKQEDDFLAAYDERNNVYRARGENYEALEKARRRKSYEAIVKQEESCRLSEEDVKAADKKFRSFCDDLWKEQDQWLLTNNKFFDPEKDYDQIEDLYNQAANGRLFLSDLSGYNQGRKQILVQEDGKSVVGPSYRSMDDKKIQHNDLSSAKRHNNQALEQKYGEIPTLNEIPKRPKELPEPKKPGAFSWFKRIISFGFAKGDFDRYDQQKREQEQRREEIRQYDENLPQLKEEIRQHNLAVYKRYDEIVSLEHKSEYPNVKNVGQMTLMQKMIDSADVKKFFSDGEDNVWREEHEYNRRNHLLEMEIEYKENPESFNKDGTRNKEASEKYWEKKVTINADDLKEAKKEAAKLQKKQVKNDLHLRVLQEKAENRKNDDLNNLLSAEKDDPYLIGFNPWITQSETTLSQKIGALFNVPKGQLEANFGRKIVMAVCTQNQKYDINGKERPEDEVKTDAECAQDLNRLVELANNPPQTEGERDEVYQEFLVKFEILSAEETNLIRCWDSMASVIAANVEKADGNAITSGVAHASTLLAEELALKKDFDFLSATVEMNGKDVSVSTSYDREIACKVGGRCLKLRDGYQRRMEARKEGFVTSSDDVVKAKPAKELTTKRPLNLGK